MSENPPPDARSLQGPLLAAVSRSFYLSLRFLPPPVRGALSVGYLLARAADTMADVEASPAAERLGLLAQFRTALTEGPDAEFLKQARAFAAAAADPEAAARDICQWIYDEVQYMSGITGVHTTAAEAWMHKKGVCQDIAHVTLGALRSVGIPARYVSGYLQSKPDAEIGETIVGESHAWVEWFTGDWFGYDPTNMLNIGERHVLIARGRDYKDVSPLRGVYAGASASGVFVKVEITREA